MVFGHHFAAIAGPGPLVGPVLAAQFGFLPGTLWILIGATLGGGVHDMIVLFASVRRRGKTLGQMVKEEIGRGVGALALISVLAIMIILLAVLALVVVQALAKSPWGVFTIAMTIPIALTMGAGLRSGKFNVAWISAFGLVGLIFAVWGGQFLAQYPSIEAWFRHDQKWIAWAIMIYGLAASILPVWMLLTPRDYLSTFLKLGTVAALALAVVLLHPTLLMPSISRFVDGSGLGSVSRWSSGDGRADVDLSAGPRREDDVLTGRWRTNICRGHGAHVCAGVGQPDGARTLVSLRHHVRSAFYSYGD